MPEEEIEDVNTEESSPSETPSEPQTEEVEQPEPQQEEAEPVQAPAVDVDERGVSWRNRAMEAERKFQDVPTIIRQTLEETMKNQQPKQQEYTIEQLEQYAIDHPEYRPQIEARKAEIIQKNLEKSMDARLQANDQRVRESQIRQQSEQWVTNHPKFKDCFVTDGVGRKQWNMGHPLTQIMGNYLNQTDPMTGKPVRDRADGLEVAAKMAYADYSLNMEPKSATQVAQLKRQLKKTQTQTMVQGGGRVPAVTAKSAVKKSIENYGKTYNKNDIKEATKAHLVAMGLIKEE